MHIQFLPAFNGDAIYISYRHNNKPVNILIDGGTKQTYETKGKKNEIVEGPLKSLIKKIKDSGQKINLLILTHIDDDHIGGILKWMERDTRSVHLIEKVWFNSGRTIAGSLNEEVIKIPEIPISEEHGRLTGVNQGVTFEKVIRDKGIWDEMIVKQGQTLKFEGLEFKILSPSVANLRELHDKWEKERSDSMTGADTDYDLSLEHHLANLISDPDDSIHNGSSIAFILVYKGKNLLLLADAHAQTVIDGLDCFGYSKTNPLISEFVKLSHHGSNRNLSIDMLEIIGTNQFIVSTNGLKHGHPDKKGLAKILKCKTDPRIRFNYPRRIDDIFSAEDRAFLEFKTDSILDGIEISEE